MTFQLTQLPKWMNLPHSSIFRSYRYFRMRKKSNLILQNTAGSKGRCHFEQQYRDSSVTQEIPDRCVELGILTDKASNSCGIQSPSSQETVLDGPSIPNRHTESTQSIHESMNEMGSGESCCLVEAIQETTPSFHEGAMQCPLSPRVVSNHEPSSLMEFLKGAIETKLTRRKQSIEEISAILTNLPFHLQLKPTV